MIGAHELTVKADLTYRQVDVWTRGGLLEALDSLPGSGCAREYPDDQLPLARLMSRLTKAGVPPTVAREAAGQILDQGHAILGGFVLVPIPDDGHVDYVADVPIPYVASDGGAAS